MFNLNEIAKEINEILDKKRKELKLTFTEEGHIYEMLDRINVLRDDFPSVSSVLEEFFDPFDAEQKALDMCYGNVSEQQLLLESWKALGDYATNKGSRVHYELEKYAVDKSRLNKVVRKPEFVCDEQQIIDGDNMIKAGKEFYDLMLSRGCVLIDTEVILGSNRLGYVGQADNAWLSYNKDKTGFGIIKTDWKTNKVKNLIPQAYNDYLYAPFNEYKSYALSHYYLQLPLYSRLFKDMLKGTKYEDTPILGGIVVSVRDDGSYVEYRVPKIFQDTILNMDLTPYIKTKKQNEKEYD